MDGDVTLTVVLEGVGPGLEEGRLPLSAFNASFRELLKAYRGIATHLLTAATGVDIDSRGQGRWPRLVASMDFEIESITHNSPATLRFVCSVPRPVHRETSELFAKDIVRRSAVELLASVDAESAGMHRNRHVRSFLSKLPVGTARQTWTLYDNGDKVKTVSVTAIRLPGDGMASAGLVHAEGRVTGVHFAPDDAAVRLLVADENYLMRAKESLVEEAIKLRGSAVTFAALQRGKRFELLWLRAVDSRRAATREERDRYFAQKWQGVLQRLAK